MAKKRHARRHRRPSPGKPRRAKRRRANPFGMSLVRHRRRASHGGRRKGHRRRRNPFGLGKGRGGIFQIPNLTQALVGVLGGVGTIALLTRIDKPDASGKTKLPALVGKDGKASLAGYAVRAAAGVLVGGLLGKTLKKPALGAAFALGSVVIAAADYMREARVLGLSGVGDYVTDYYGGSTSGTTYQLGPSVGQYEEPDAIEGLGFEDSSDMDESTQTPF